MKKSIALLLPLLFAPPSGAIEVPLESLGKTTNVAYVNMHRVFEAFPDT